jgi:hypothetical protein
MTFICSYRGLDGRIRKEVVEAPSRASAMVLLKKRGITPMSVVAGASVSAEGRPVAKALVRGAVAGIIVVGVAIAAWMMLSKPAKPVHTPPSSTKASQPSAKTVTNVSKGTKAASDGEKVRPSRRTASGSVRGGVEEPSPSIAQESEAPQSPPPQPERPPLPEPLLRNGAEQLLRMATPSAPGMPVPPLPIRSDEDMGAEIKAALTNVIHATSNDTEQTLQVKMNVIEQKEEFMKLRKEGWTFTEYVKALAEKHNDEAKYLDEARKLVQELHNDATLSDEDYKKERAAINQALREKGLPEIKDDEDEDSSGENKEKSTPEAH